MFIDCRCCRATLEGEIHRLKSDYERDKAAAIKRAKDSAAKVHSAELLQLRRNALQAYKDDMASIKKTNMHEINRLKAMVTRLEKEAVEKEEARQVCCWLILSIQQRTPCSACCSCLRCIYSAAACPEILF